MVATIAESEWNANESEKGGFKALSPSQLIFPALCHWQHDYENRPFPKGSNFSSALGFNLVFESDKYYFRFFRQSLVQQRQPSRRN